jgi:hypothetical protein
MHSEISEDDRLLVAVKDTAKILSIGRTKTWALISAGRLETVKIGRRTLVRMASIRDLAEEGDT